MSAAKPNDNYKLIFMDCNMPVMNGYTACKKIKRLIKKGKLDNIVIVACTADTTEPNFERCRNSRFDHILTKPVDKDILVRFLRKYVGKNMK